MASVNMAFGMAAVKGKKAFVTKAIKSIGRVQEEKGLLDWILGGLQKEDQFFETDPILNKVKGKGSTKSTTSTNDVAVSNKKKFQGLGGLFAKN